MIWSFECLKSEDPPPLTTGELKLPDNGGVKTIYDPSVWTDAKLETAVKEAALDHAKRHGNFIERKALIGTTSEGYKIEFFYHNGKIETFYFI